MNYEDVKNVLQSAYWWNKKLETDKAFLEQLRDISSTVRAVQYDAIHVQGGSHHSAVEDCVIRLADYEQKIIEDISGLQSSLEQIDQFASMLSETRKQTLIRRRYQMFETWEKIAFELGYTWQYMHILHKSAVKEIAQKLSKAG